MISSTDFKTKHTTTTNKSNSVARTNQTNTPQYPDSTEIVGYRSRRFMHLSLSMNSELLLQLTSLSRLTRDVSSWDRQPLASASCRRRDASAVSSCRVSSSKLREARQDEGRRGEGRDEVKLQRGFT